ncbi:MarR family winged helix-turn-helix transcriptional regulator [Antarcticimicrobium luteum]|nr:MarR family transcriptional regulator [Antarcticimicrobium luteum]
MISIHLLHETLEARIEAADLDQTVPKNDILMLIRLTEPMRMGSLAEEMLVLPSTLTAIADRLEEAGLIRRRRDPEDRRAWLLDVTDKGRALQSHIMALSAEMFRSVTGLSAAEIGALGQMMHKVRRNIIECGYTQELMK